MASYEPLRVIAHLRSGIVADAWLPLDAVLDYQAKRQRFGAQEATAPGGPPAPPRPDPDVPLQIHHAATDNWYYACSWAQPQPWWLAEGRDYWNKRFDGAFAYLVDFAGRRGKVVVKEGTYRAYHMPVFYFIARQVEWYCLGDQECITELLSTVTHIGKKRSQGWGRVAAWTVQPWPHDWSLRREGQLTRGLPLFEAPDGIPAHYGLRPPYHSRFNQMVLACPPIPSAIA